MNEQEQQETISAAMSILGSRKSAAKTKACRENASRPRPRMTDLERQRALTGKIKGNSKQKRTAKRRAATNK